MYYSLLSNELWFALKDIHSALIHEYKMTCSFPVWFNINSLTGTLLCLAVQALRIPQRWEFEMKCHAL